MDSEDLIVCWACGIAGVLALLLIWLEPPRASEPTQPIKIVKQPLKA